ncbi:hypothetical protein PVAP13_2KG282700 [Panicum virgatum]|uniref:Uncharacterized protein n=1 Tax=Panicum virgatum TaxID=38727 RepID=A0A8T0WC91_PANVG|nr:hypothetical protein PVAP13_2KG282700 [Panicum virgatum]
MHYRSLAALLPIPSPPAPSHGGSERPTVAHGRLPGARSGRHGPRFGCSGDGGVKNAAEVGAAWGVAAPEQVPPQTLAHHSSLAGHSNGASSSLPCGGPACASCGGGLTDWDVARPGTRRCSPLRSLVAVRPLSVSCVELELELLVTRALQPCQAACRNLHLEWIITWKSSTQGSAMFPTNIPRVETVARKTPSSKAKRSLSQTNKQFISLHNLMNAAVKLIRTRSQQV